MHIKICLKGISYNLSILWNFSGHTKFSHSYFHLIHLYLSLLLSTKLNTSIGDTKILPFAGELASGGHTKGKNAGIFRKMKRVLGLGLFRSKS